MSANGPTGKKFVIKVALPPNREKGFTKTMWLSIGYGTELEYDGKTKLMCTLSAIPLNWNGEFVMFEKDPNWASKEE